MCTPDARATSRIVAGTRTPLRVSPVTQVGQLMQTVAQGSTGFDCGFVTTTPWKALASRAEGDIGGHLAVSVDSSRPAMAPCVCKPLHTQRGCSMPDQAPRRRRYALVGTGSR